MSVRNVRRVLHWFPSQTRSLRRTDRIGLAFRRTSTSRQRITTPRNGFLGTLTMAAVAGAGLEGIVATSSSICYIDGDEGILSYQGYDIHTLAENATFEETIYLLWHGKLPTQTELDELKASLAAKRA